MSDLYMCRTTGFNRPLVAAVAAADMAAVPRLIGGARGWTNQCPGGILPGFLNARGKDPISLCNRNCIHSFSSIMVGTVKAFAALRVRKRAEN